MFSLYQVAIIYKVIVLFLSIVFVKSYGKMSKTSVILMKEKENNVFMVEVVR